MPRPAASLCAFALSTRIANRVRCIPQLTTEIAFQRDSPLGLSALPRSPSPPDGFLGAPRPPGQPSSRPFPPARCRQAFGTLPRGSQTSPPAMAEFAATLQAIANRPQPPPAAHAPRLDCPPREPVKPAPPAHQPGRSSPAPGCSLLPSTTPQTRWPVDKPLPHRPADPAAAARRPASRKRESATEYTQDFAAPRRQADPPARAPVAADSPASPMKTDRPTTGQS